MKQDEKIENEIMLPLIEALEKAIVDLRKYPQVNQTPADEQKPAKKLVDWTIKGMRGCIVTIQTFGDNKRFVFNSANAIGESLVIQNRPQAAFFPSVDALRLAKPEGDEGWQAYIHNEENEKMLRVVDSQCDVEIRFGNMTLNNSKGCYLQGLFYPISAYRIIGLKKGFTDVPESAT